MKSKESMTIEEALDAFLADIAVITDAEQVPLLRAAGRILAEDIRAPFSVPSFPKSAMDGYAVRAAEVAGASKERPVILRVVGERLAGDTVSKDELIKTGSAGNDARAARQSAGEISEEEFGGTIGRADGESAALSGCENTEEKTDKLPVLTAVRIMTGAQVPTLYDAVVKQEDTDYGEDAVQIFSPVKPYQNYCAVGEDIRKDEVVLSEGTRLGRIEIGVLASLGFAKVPVRRNLKVRIISTGSELCDVEDDTVSVEKEGNELPPGKIFNSIAYMLEAAVLPFGFEADHCICDDDADRIKETVQKAAAEYDVVITTGGVSVGKKDLIPEVLDQMGADVRFQRAKIQPGTPTIGSVYQGVPILSLSGNPYAAIANFDLYFWPLAARQTGCDELIPAVETAVLDSPYEKVNVSRRLLRACVQNGKVVFPAKSHASSVLSNLTKCNCYVDLPAGQQVRPGDQVVIRRMPMSF
ncbi:MAG: molybdopterin molybdotransferase MoeA [Lachnospiraceae bacterium]|nr:molybdopterin molybdotransferase MoeA [Lachnospiraceae bacterium]